MEFASVKAYKGIGMEGWIAKWYAANTRKGLEDFRALARRVAGQLAPGSKVLELAPGPGYFAIELAKLSSYQITGSTSERVLWRSRAGMPRRRKLRWTFVRATSHTLRSPTRVLIFCSVAPPSKISASPFWLCARCIAS